MLTRTPPRISVGRLVVVVVLVLAAIVWPFVEIGPKGAVLFSVSRDHGVDVHDLLALLLLAAAAVVARPRR